MWRDRETEIDYLEFTISTAPYERLGKDEKPGIIIKLGGKLKY